MQQLRQSAGAALAAALVTIGSGCGSSPTACKASEACIRTSAGDACVETCSPDGGGCPAGVCTEVSGCCTGTGCAAVLVHVCCPAGGC